MSNKESTVWAQLVSTTDTDSDPVTIGKNKFIIGRSKFADLCLVGNKLVSGSHCFIERDKQKKAWLQDTSTNGTLLNAKTKLSGIKHELQHGDEIHIVYRKEDETLNVAYLFQDVERLKEEEAQDTSAEDLDATQVIQENDISDEDSGKEDTDLDPYATGEEADLDEISGPNQGASALVRDNTVEVPAAKRKASELVQESTDGDPLEGARKKIKSDSLETIEGEKDVKEGEVKKGDTQEPEAKDAFEETLMCIICQEILHDCVSCQPCLHAFCAGCYSDWMVRSNECPSCRTKVDQVNKNHIVNNLVEAYLKEHPEKKRSDSDIAELNAKNKITQDTVKQPKLKKTMSEFIDEEEDEDEDYSDSSLSENNDEGTSAPAPPPFGSVIAPTGFGLVPTLTPFGTVSYTGTLFPSRVPKTVCRQCPDYKDTSPSAPGTFGAAVAAIGSVVGKVVDIARGGPSTSDGPSTSAAGDDDKPSTSAGSTSNVPTPPPFKCSPNQIHLLCQCCFGHMPDRRTDSNTNPTIPKQQCTMCMRFFCHLYWGCRKAGCHGCLARFRDLTFDKTILDNLILENAYESDIFKNYMETKDLTLKDLQVICCGSLESGEYTCMDHARGLTPNTVVCYGCGLRNFRDLAYQYRSKIPPGDLPDAVRARPDCYWGKNCRTQKGKIHHAAKFNHICEQTKTS